MVSKAHIVELVKGHLNHILLVAQSSLPASQFHAFRTVVLNEFGRNGLERELDQLEGSMRAAERVGEGRNT